MGYAGVVTSEMFGLSAALDTFTQDLLQRKRRLSAKEILSESEKKELSDLTKELDSYGFRYQVRDPELKKELKGYLTFEQSGNESSGQLSSAEDEEKAERLVRLALKQKSGKDRDA